MKKAKSSQPNYLKSMIIPTTIGLILLVTYVATEDIMVRILCAFITLTMLIPFVLQLTAFLFTGIATTPSKARDVKNVLKNQAPTIHTEEKPKVQYKNKGKVNPSQYYIPCRDVIISCVKNKIFTRQDILTLLKAIDYRLGSHKEVYNKNFTFENEMHEIYCKLKSKKLQDADYIYLFEVVNKIVERNTGDMEVTQ